MSAAKLGYEDDNETPAKAAVAVADAYTKVAGLPTYSELAALLRTVSQCAKDFAPLGDEWPEVIEADALLSRIPS